MKTIFILILCLATIAFSMAQTGTISGVVTESTSGSEQPVPFCNVIIAGTSTGATSNFDGMFSFEAEPGTYRVVFSYIGLRTDTIGNIKVIAGETTSVDHAMRSNAIQIETFEVEAIADRESDKILMLDRKESSDMTQNIGAKELKGKGLSDAAEGAKKIVGLSVVGAGYLYVRGLGDRYNSAYLNGMPLPSPDPDNKVPSLDIFPTDVLSNLKVTKSYAANYYGDLTGGAFDIGTKQLPNEGILKVKVGAVYNQNSTFQNFKTYNGGKNDFWGMEDGTRALPVEMLAGRYQGHGESSPFSQNFNSVNRKAPVDVRFGLLGGNSISLGNKTKLGYMVSANYRNESKTYKGKYRIYNALGNALLDYDYESYQFNTQTSGLGSLSLEFDKRHNITFTSLLVNTSGDEFLDNGGYHFDYDNNVHARRYTFIQNKLWTNQLKGDHNFMKGNRLNANWYLGYSRVNSNEPDRRQLTYIYPEDRPSTNWLYNTLDKLENQRWYRELDETDVSAHFELGYGIIKKEIKGNMISIFSIKGGMDMRMKERIYQHRIFAYELAPMNSSFADGFDLDRPDNWINDENYEAGNYYASEETGPEARHTISQDITAGYLMADIEIIPTKLKLVTGARVEMGDQVIRYRKQSDSYFQPIRSERIQTNDVLPFANIKYDINDKNILRLSGSKTLSRPGFREMAPFEYTEYFAGTKNTGNPELINGENYNLDVRYEIFTGSGEVIAIGAFGKYLKNPIEKVMLATASGQLQSFKNTQQAQVAGIEAEIVKNLGFFSNDTNIFNNLSVGFNATFMHSNVTIDRTQKEGEATVVLTNDDRPLQGASPWLLNIDLTYSKWLNPNFRGGLSIAFNTFGRRVWAAGADGLDDMYEKSVPQLNLILTGEIKEKWTIRLGAKNLLDPAVEIVQENNGRETVLNTFKRGIDVGFTIGYRII